mmetsp:Transcript_81861/g.149589  ORF Transcript_81861/g.149589 Transcript_81861/m.149589 type:complete len:236 (+) Transcript_81861:186-893(+)
MFLVVTNLYISECAASLSPTGDDTEALKSRHCQKEHKGQSTNDKHRSPKLALLLLQPVLEGNSLTNEVALEAAGSINGVLLRQDQQKQLAKEHPELLSESIEVVLRKALNCYSDLLCGLVRLDLVIREFEIEAYRAQGPQGLLKHLLCLSTQHIAPLQSHRNPCQRQNQLLDPHRASSRASAPELVLALVDRELGNQDPDALEDVMVHFMVLHNTMVQINFNIDIGICDVRDNHL